MDYKEWHNRKPWYNRRNKAIEENEDHFNFSVFEIISLILSSIIGFVCLIMLFIHFVE